MASTRYRIKRFRRSSDVDFAAALLLYARNTAPNIRTETNEIVYWLDNFNKTFKDDFLLFGFYRNQELVGFAEAAYFVEEAIFVLDYIVIDEANRGNNVYYEFVAQLKESLERCHPEYRYAVAEVPYGSDETVPSQASSLNIRLLKMQGFKVIRAPYFQPRLVLNDPESEMKSAVLIFSNSQLNEIKAETYLGIVHVIYYKHYYRWKSIIPDSYAEYKAHLDRLYTRIQSAIKKENTIKINGHQIVLEPKQKGIFAMHRIISFAIQALLVVICLTAAMFGLRAAFGLSDSSFVIIFVLAISSFVAVAGIVSKDARTVFAQISDLVKFALNRKIGDSKTIEKGSAAQENDPTKQIEQP